MSSRPPVSLEIDGFLLILVETQQGAMLVGDPERVLYDGGPSTLLNTVISLVTKMLDRNETSLAKILAGDGTLKAILALAIDVASGRGVELPEQAIVDEP